MSNIIYCISITIGMFTTVSCFGEMFFQAIGVRKISNPEYIQDYLFLLLSLILLNLVINNLRNKKCQNIT